MKRKLVVTALTMGLSVPAFAGVESYTIDPNHTYPNFIVSHLGYSNMHGRFNKSSGKLTMDRAAKTGSVDITIEAASIDTGHQKRDDDLRSPSFFNVSEFPKLTYKSSSVKFKGDMPGTVEGNLTLLGVTKPVTLNIDAIKCGPHPSKKTEMCGIEASAQIKRSDFGMKYGLPSVGDELKLTFEVEAYKD